MERRSAPQMNEQQYQQEQEQQEQQQQQQGQYQQQEEASDLDMAKEALGLDEYEQKLNDIEQHLQETQNKAIFDSVSSKFENVDVKQVEEELVDIAKENPQMANMLRTDPKGLEMIFNKVNTASKPLERPDEITDSGDSATNFNEFSKKLDNGSASELDLGSYILGNQ